MTGPVDGADLPRVAADTMAAAKFPFLATMDGDQPRLRPVSPVRTEGVNLYLADGAAAGQEVFHSHLHVVPRWAGDGMRVSAERRGGPPSRDELERVAASIRAAAID